jgi:hypothetical protein
LDLRRAFAALLIAVAAIGASSALPLPEAKWIAPEARLDALTSSPPVCIGTVIKRDQLLIAEAAFQTPLLLGGQAARAGLSCASCHPSGRANSAFQFPGLSSDPGTADVTSSVMSHHRGDFVFNPVRIPDLAVDRPKVTRDATSPALRSFIRGLIVEEFDGPEPPAAVLDALVSYVRAMRLDRCTSSKRIPISLGRHLADSAAALEMARFAEANGDEATAWLMMAAARHSLGLIHERYSDPALGTQRDQIIAADRKIQALQSALSLKTPVNAASVREIIDGLRLTLTPSEPKSLYNPIVLAQALGG